MRSNFLNVFFLLSPVFLACTPGSALTISSRSSTQEGFRSKPHAAPNPSDFMASEAVMAGIGVDPSRFSKEHILYTVSTSFN
jgi:hypothetical protein